MTVTSAFDDYEDGSEDEGAYEVVVVDDGVFHHCNIDN